jgi:four helix bundle protein
MLVVRPDVCRSSFDDGTIRDGPFVMIAKRYEDLEAWQLADELRQTVFALTETGRAARDFKFCDQIRDAVSSAARNISEGFGRFRPPDFARFMEYSLSSTMEAQDLLTDGIERGHFTEDTAKPARKLAKRSLQVSKGLMRYLKSCKKPRNPRRKPNGKRQPPNGER